MTITVEELMDVLAQLPPGAPVLIPHQQGWHGVRSVAGYAATAGVWSGVVVLISTKKAHRGQIIMPILATMRSLPGMEAEPEAEPEPEPVPTVQAQGEEQRGEA